MTIHRLTPLRIAVSFLPALALFGVAHEAAAEECGDVTCDVGFVCNTYEGGDEPFYSCDRAPCETDADCGDLLVCGTFETVCAELLIACAEGEDCVPPDNSECEAGEFKQCAAPWELPCEAAADCGPGFTCESYEVCDCAEFTEGPDGEITCNDCRQSDDKYCVQEQIECAAAADCPADWTCAEQWVGTCDEDSCTDEMGLRCQPPEVWGPYSGDPEVTLAAADGGPIAENGIAEDGAVNDGPTMNGEVATLGDPEVASDDSATEEEAAEDVDTAVEESGEPSDGDNAPVIEDEPGAGDDVIGQNAANGDPSNSENGCSVAAAPQRGAGFGLLALGLAALLTGRRRKAS
jgi:MYXO-CTERM domain-containing protein